MVTVVSSYFGGGVSQHVLRNPPHLNDTTPPAPIARCVGSKLVTDLKQTPTMASLCRSFDSWSLTLLSSGRTACVKHTEQTCTSNARMQTSLIHLIHSLNQVELIPHAFDDAPFSPHYALSHAEMNVQMAAIADELGLNVSLWRVHIRFDSRSDCCCTHSHHPHHYYTSMFIHLILTGQVPCVRSIRATLPERLRAGRLSRSPGHGRGQTGLAKSFLLSPAGGHALH